jgi:hypothetical protein
MKSQTINQLPIVEPRESTISIEDIRTKLSSINHEATYFTSEVIFNVEVFLCLANKIHELEQEIDNLKQKQVKE